MYFEKSSFTCFSWHESSSSESIEIMAASLVSFIAFKKRRACIEWRLSQNKQIINYRLQVKSKTFGLNSEAATFEKVRERINECITAEFAVFGKTIEKRLLHHFEEYALDWGVNQTGDEPNSHPLQKREIRVHLENSEIIK